MWGARCREPDRSSVRKWSLSRVCFRQKGVFLSLGLYSCRPLLRAAEVTVCMSHEQLVVYIFILTPHINWHVRAPFSSTKCTVPGGYRLSLIQLGMTQSWVSQLNNMEHWVESYWGSEWVNDRNEWMNEQIWGCSKGCWCLLCPLLPHCLTPAVGDSSCAVEFLT